MSQLISLTVTNRGPLLPLLVGGPSLYGFDIEDIVSPIIFNSNRSSFTSRTNKGGVNDDRNSSKIDYMVSDTLSSIVAQSPLLLLLNVVSRRGIVKNNQEYVFVSSKITESLVPVIGGTKFYYIEDGDPLPVEYIVTQSVSTIVSASIPTSTLIVQDNGSDMPQENKLNFVNFVVEDNPGNNSTDIIAVKSVTFVQLQTIVSAGSMPLGAEYLITDGADAGIIVTVSAPNKISLRAKGLFLNPDFQNVGVYSGLSTPKGTNRVMWRVAIEAVAVNGDITFWDGNMYQVLSAAAFAGTNPAATPAAYTLLSKNVTNGYILEADDIIYDFTTNTIVGRSDKRGNVVNSMPQYFQWGNNSVFFNTINTGPCTCINVDTTGGDIAYNTFNATTTITGTCISIDNCVINAGTIFNNCGFVSYVIINTPCTFDNNFVDFPTGGEINPETSTLDARIPSPGIGSITLDMDNPSIFMAGVLTIPIEYVNIGLFYLKGTTGNTISKIENLSTVFRRTRFKILEDGNNQLFDHTSIASATINNLVSDAASINTIEGRTNGADFIDYERMGDFNVRVNIVKLA